MRAVVSEGVTVRAAAKATVEPSGNPKGSVSMKFRYTDKSKPRVPATGAGAVLGKESISDFLTIRVAGNEQKPLDFNSLYVKSGRGPIKTFDYSLEGDQDSYAVERKSLSDYISSIVLTDKWKHELAKIERAREWLLPIVYIVEAKWSDIRTYDYSIFHSGRVTSQSVYRKWAIMVFELGVHVVWSEDREGAAYAICLLLKRRKESLKCSNANGAK